MSTELEHAELQRKRVRVSLAKRREVLKARGLCVDCGKAQAKPGRVLCLDCLEVRRERMRKAKGTRKENAHAVP